MTDTPLIPRSVLFGPPDRVAPQLSPDGAQLIYLAPHRGAPNVWLRSVDRADDRPLTADTGRGVLGAVWAYDGAHVLYLQDTAGDEAYHLFAVSVRTGRVRDLTPYPGVRTEVVALEPGAPHEVLVSVGDRDPAWPDAYRLDLRTGQRVLAARNEGFGATTGTWLADTRLRVRGALRALPDGGGELLVRDDEQAPWRRRYAWEPDDDWTTAPISFTPDGTGIWLLTSVGTDTSRLALLDVATGAVRTVHADDRHDIGAFLAHPRTKQIRLLTYDRERCENVVLDQEIAAAVALLDSAARRLGAGELVVTGTDADDRRWLAEAVRDDGPGTYLLLDRDRGEVRELFPDRAALAGYALVPLRPIAVPARDGLTLPGYLAAPHGMPAGPLPTVLSVHGGPWARESWGMNPEAQWLANRGYLWVTVNFRGSRGYGKRFLGAGDRQWGAAMQDDLLDTVDWLVAQGWADPGRVAVMGASYGGYAALCGAAFTPGRFRCAVDVCGPTDLRTLLASLPPWWESLASMWRRRIGDPRTDADRLWRRSPLSRAADIRCPLLVVQGANDPRVPMAESDQLVAALRRHRVPHEYVVLPGEGHGFFAPDTELAVRGRIERFLAEHLGGRYEPAAPPTEAAPPQAVGAQ
ncbi:MAG TPA: S9 family peptidase [Pilimelia sp.]|nr:S9 family peptidase [Pilimelia sp.]